MPDADVRLKLQDWMQESGYRANLHDEDDRKMIFSAAAGLKFTLGVYNDDNLQFSLLMALGEGDFGIDGCNAFNRRYRFAKAYIDDDDLVMEYNFLINLDEPTAKERFVRQLELWDGAIGLLRSAVRDALRSKKADAVSESAES